MKAKYDTIDSNYNANHKADPYITQQILDHPQPKGLASLKADIKTSKMQKVMQTYSNQNGDYLFIIGKKGSKSV